MSAGRAVEWFYDHLTRGRDPEEIDRLHADLLGDEAARSRVAAREQEQRRSLVDATGGAIR